MERSRRAFAINRKELVDSSFNRFLNLIEFRRFFTWPVIRTRLGQVLANGIGQHKVTIGQTLHEGTCPQSIGTMIRKVGLSNHKQSWDVTHKVIIHPKPAHGVMYRRVNRHWVLVGIGTGDLFVHIKKIAITLTDNILAHAIDGISKIQINSKP